VERPSYARDGKPKIAQLVGSIFATCAFSRSQFSMEDDLVLVLFTTISSSYRPGFNDYDLIAIRVCDSSDEDDRADDNPEDDQFFSENSSGFQMVFWFSGLVVRV
jgi:hypothetical protein